MPTLTITYMVLIFVTIASEFWLLGFSAMDRKVITSFSNLALGILDVIFGILSFFNNDPISGIVTTALGIVLLYLAWRFFKKDRDRKKILKAIGAKTRALLAKVSESAKELSDKVRNPLPGVVPVSG